ncbi:hypothetical protein KDL44_08435 [bacterium]|nr:hypothetical protein [bacterium]
MLIRHADAPALRPGERQRSIFYLHNAWCSTELGTNGLESIMLRWSGDANSYSDLQALFRQECGSAEARGNWNGFSEPAFNCDLPADNQRLQRDADGNVLFICLSEPRGPGSYVIHWRFSAEAWQEYIANLQVSTELQAAAPVPAG